MSTLEKKAKKYGKIMKKNQEQWYCENLAPNLIVCGDLNINFLDDSIDKNMLVDLFNSHGLTETSLLPTRIFINKRSAAVQKLIIWHGIVTMIIRRKSFSPTWAIT
ncbi:hypothetical protein HHI36_024217 [Cryptolaemus montrouzieri]|uniref:Endonuclease/exonuclease/phosphatase domain-containing protein n=1 Tax=Cryptolaemus montrouzieri TaxID=559131 RepID=A0ABD2N537_9CUCU